MHPRQVPIANEVYVPTHEEYEYARGITEAFTAAEARGEGSYQHDGQLIEVPVKRDFERIVALYERAHTAAPR